MGAFDVAWTEIIRENKKDAILTLTGNRNYLDHEVYLDDFYNFSLLDGTTLEEVITRMNDTYIGASWAVKTARRVFGIGVFKGGGEEVHFAHLLNTALPTSGGAYDNHNTDEWIVGPSMLLCFNYFQNLTRKRYAEDVREALSKRKSYTWADLESFADVFTDVKISGNGATFNGGAEPVVFKPMRRHLPFSALPSTGSAKMLAAPSSANLAGMEAAAGDVWKTGVAFQDTTMATYRGIWLTAFIHANLPDKYRLYHTTQLSIEDLSMEMFMGMFYDTDGVDTTNKYDLWGFHLVEMIEARTPSGKPKRRYFWMYATAETKRYEHVINVLATTGSGPAVITNPAISLKYMYFIARSGISASDVISFSRPKGLVDTSYKFVQDYGQEDNQRLLIESALLVPVGDGGKPPVESKPAATQPSTPDDNPGLQQELEDEESEA
jgi:hypothetical protein